MTFVLKDFEALKEHFNKTIRVLLIRDYGQEEAKKKTITDLKSRKEEVLFLNAVLTELEERIKHNNPKSLEPFVEIFYGAQTLIQQDTKDNLGYFDSDGLLFNRLNLGMGITESDFPDNYQKARHYKVLNNFLKLIYKEGDSRNGLQVPNALDAVPLQKLTTLITKGHQLEEAAQKKITEGYHEAGKTEGHANSFPVAYDVPASAIAKFDSFETLKKELDDLVLGELGSKNVASVDVYTDEKRVAQLNSLLAMANTLNASKVKPSEKISILAGMMLLVREQIGHEYGKQPFSNDDITKTMLSNGSVVHTELTKILNAKTMSREDAQALIISAKNFMTYMTIEHSESKGEVKESIREKHIFSDVAGFKLVPVLDFMQKLIRCAAIDSLDRSVIAYEKTLPKEAPVSWTSTVTSFFGKKSTKEVVDDTLPEKEVEKKVDESTTPTYG